MTVKFTQYLQPNGRKRELWIRVPSSTQEEADKFIAAGGWYEIEILRDGTTVSLTACFKMDGEPQDVAIRLVQNGPEVPEAAALLIKESVEYLEDEVTRCP